MRRSTNMVIILTVIVGGWGQMRAWSAEKPSVRLEFRRAESKPAKGLEEATEAGTGKKVYLYKTAELTNEDIAEASIIASAVEGERLLQLKFTERGREKMEKLTKEHQDKPLAVLMDGKVLVAPICREVIRDQAVLNGIEMAELERIVKGLKAK